MKLTDEQKEILKGVEDGIKVIKINAYAGTGKTTTLVEIAKANQDKKILYLAFNKSIQLEATKKFPKNVTVKTTHALAWGIVNRFTDLSNLRGEYKPQELESLFLVDRKSANLIAMEFANYCNSANTEPRLDYVRELFEKIDNGELAPTHSYYLKKMQLLLNKQAVNMREYDIVLLDEAQDTNDVTLDIFYNLPAKQKILVGDRHQQIYSFRGSVNAMSKVDAKVFHLTNSFRFNDDIAQKASEILRIFKGDNNKIKGLGKTEQIKNRAIVSRTNATLIRTIDFLIEKKANYKTVREPYAIFGLSLNLLNLVESPERIDHQYRYLKYYLQKARGKTSILNVIKEDAELNGDVELKSSVSIVEKYKEKLWFFYEDAKKRYEKLPDSMVEVFLTTAHTSKGLEWDEVQLTDDFYIINRIARWLVEQGVKSNVSSPMAEFLQRLKSVKQDIIDEINLYYVAVTRAKVACDDETEVDFILNKGGVKKLDKTIAEEMKEIEIEIGGEQ